MGQKTNIKVNGRLFGITVNSEAEEELYRNAAAVVDANIEKRKAQFAGKSLEDLLTFVAFNECKSRIKSQMELEQIKSELDTLQKQLETYLENIDK